MKALSLILLGSIGLMMSSVSFAGCGASSSCGYSTNQCTQSQVYCDELMGPCQCTDPGYNRYHTCMTEAEYCRVFGNMGAH